MRKVGDLMYKVIRQEKIIEEIAKDSAISVRELAKMFDTSIMTIRRDMDELSHQGIIKRTHGGAVLNKKDLSQPAFYERQEENRQQKTDIAKEAIKLIKNGSIVFFDAGTTPYAIAQLIPGDLNFSAITTGLLTAVALCQKPNVNVISIGGDMHKSSFSAVDSMAVESIKNLHADIAFISTKAVQLPQGTFESKFSLIEIKRAIVSVSDKVVLVADSTKFQSHSLALSIPITDIDTVITDSGISVKTREELFESGKEIIVV